MERRPDDAASPPAWPALPAVSRWLLRSHGAQSPSGEDELLAAEAVYALLRARLSILLGTLGFDALWARALRLAARDLALPDQARFDLGPASGASGLRELAAGDAAATPLLLQTILTGFLTLLVTFIGEPLTFRLLYQLWPALASGAAAGSAAAKDQSS